MRDPADAPDHLARLRDACLRFPEVSERLSHGSPAWFVRGTRALAYGWVYGHHDRLEPHAWFAAPPGLQEELVAADPETFFRPPYVGHRGWVGVRLHDDTDWDHLATLAAEAYRQVAPAALVRRLNATRGAERDA